MKLDKYKWIISISVLIIILFLVFVIYSKSQWISVESEVTKETAPSGNNTVSSTGGGHVRFIILADNETNCTDDIDNDGDGLNNCMDPDCSEEIVCQDEKN